MKTIVCDSCGKRVIGWIIIEDENGEIYRICADCNTPPQNKTTGGYKMLSYDQARVIAGIQLQNMPANIHPTEIARYYSNRVEIIHNEAAGFNRDYVEILKNDCHRIIAECYYRPGFLN